MIAQVDVLAVMDAEIASLGWEEMRKARAAVAALIAERDALRASLQVAEQHLALIGTPRDAQGRYHKEGEWTFGDALPNAADAREVASAFAVIVAALARAQGVQS